MLADVTCHLRRGMGHRQCSAFNTTGIRAGASPYALPVVEFAELDYLPITGWAKTTEVAWSVSAGSHLADTFFCHAGDSASSKIQQLVEISAERIRERAFWDMLICAPHQGHSGPPVRLTPALVALGYPQADPK